MNQRGFTIPVNILPERRAEIQKLLLYVASDENGPWVVHEAATPDKGGFQYVAEKDGMYYFNIAIVNREGKQEPENVAKIPIGMKILVDTTNPQVHLSTERQGEEIQVSWDIVEANPDPSTLKLEYRSADAAPELWTALPITPGPKGKAMIRPAPVSAVAVRMQMTDQAGNAGKDEVVVPAAIQPRPQPSALVDYRPAAKDERGPAAEVSPMPRDTEHWPAGNPTLASSSTGGVPTPIAGNQPAKNDAPAIIPSVVRGELPQVQIINKRQVKLDFDVTRYGPSGLGAVDVYVTMDDGKTWAKSPTDGGVSLPMAADVKPGQPLHGSVTVQLNKEEPVIYGFWVVVKSRAGLGKAAPKAGDAPQLRVEVDTTPPFAELYAPVPDHDRRDALLLTWKATDRNLAPSPITLEWAERKEGPWTAIGEQQMTNTGRFSWPVPVNTPPNVYLKLTARDTAGNIAVAETSEPVLIDLTMPEFNELKINSVTAIPNK
jgi:hypothetical protein